MTLEKPEIDPQDPAVVELLSKLGEAENAVNSDSDWLTLDKVRKRLQI